MPKTFSLALVLLLAATAGAAVRPHPRIEINPATLKTMRGLRDSNNPIWTRYYDQVKRNTARAGDANAVVTCSLAYLVDGSREHFQCAWDLVRAKLYKNGRDGAEGIVTLLAMYNNDTHSAAYIGGSYMAGIARFYDWCFPELTPGQRKDLVEWMKDAAEYSHVRNGSAGDYMRNDGAVVTHGVAAVAVAIAGDHPDAERIMTYFRERWRQTLLGLDIVGKGGATGEGNGYGASPTGVNWVLTANVAYTAAGEDLFASHAWFRQRLMYDAFAAYPSTFGGPGSVEPVSAHPVVEQSHVGGDDVRGMTSQKRSLRRIGLILTRRFPNTEEAGAWNWVYRQPAVDHAVTNNEAIWEVLYYSPPPRLVKPKRLSFFDPSMGFVYIRSDWDSPDATWVGFWAGPHIDTHQHLDQGAFTVFKRRDLAVKTGHYDSDVFFPHHISWYTRTVSSNGILIGDPKEIFRNFIAGMGCDENGKWMNPPKGEATWPACIANDGGQRTMSPLGLAVPNAAAFEKNRHIVDVAKVVSFADDGTSVKVAADLTNAYNNPRYTTPGNSPKVARVWRRLVYLRPLDLLLVADTVESTDPAFEKKVLLHATDRIEVGGKVERIDEGESVHTDVDRATIVVDDTQPSDKRQKTFDLRTGYAALQVKTLFPTAFRYRRIGGREPADAPHAALYGPEQNANHYHRHIKDFWIRDFSEGIIPNHRSFNWAPERPLEVRTPEQATTFVGGYGRWRLEVEPSQPARTDYFLNVMRPSLKPGSAMPAIERIETADQFGALIRDGARTWRVVFGKDALDAPVVERH
ncbi:MAG TPA: DUF4962 domain-containing protein [Bryobacteraceae bacterium]|nr:DUF4962 domain-containing protein [Bryobacteraceae bacterium]